MCLIKIYDNNIDLIYKADISTVSAKGIRKQVGQLTNSSLAPIKREFDELVIEIYTKITDEVRILSHTAKAKRLLAKKWPEEMRKYIALFLSSLSPRCKSVTHRI